MKATTLLPALVLFAIVTVEVGGWSLLSLLNRGDVLTPFQERYFRAGHAHAGVLLTLALVFLVLLTRANFSDRGQWLVGITLLVGILLQSGGFFLHMLVGSEGSGSAGTVVTRIGAVFLATALVTLGVGLLRAGDAVATISG